MNIMNIIKKTSILAMLCIGLLSCNSEIESLEFEEASKQSKSLESTVNQQLRTPGTPAAVNLGTAGSYTILSKSGITNVSPSAIVGNVGTSPITGAALLLTCAEVLEDTSAPSGTTGLIHTVAAAGPIGCTTTAASTLTTAVGDMEAAYTYAAGLTPTNDTFLNVGAGILGGGVEVILEPGVYTWGSTLLIPTNITLESAGMSDPIWIFQVAGTLTMSNNVQMTFNNSGGTTGILGDADDVFWQVSGAVTLGTGSLFQGNLLGKTSIAVQTGAKVNGRLLAQTAVTLQKNMVWAPGTIDPSIAAEAAAAAAARAAEDARKAAATAAETAKRAEETAAAAARLAAIAASGSIVELGAAGKFAILSTSGVTNVYPSVITGNVGTRPITGAALLLTCDEIVTGKGKIYTVDAAGPSCKVTNASGLSDAVGAMQAAYADAAIRPHHDPATLNVITSTSGVSLAPGLYKWTSALLMPENIILKGDEDDVWIFQVAGTLTMSNNVQMTLEKKVTSGTAPQTKNIFWQVSGAVTLGTDSLFQGNILGKTSIAVQTGATVNGRLLAQTAVTLQKNTVTGPQPTSSDAL
jgi:hypothetical protein